MVYQIPGTQFVTVLMINEKGEQVKRNVKVSEADLSRENTLIDMIVRENSQFKNDNDVIDLRRKSLIFDKKNPFAGLNAGLSSSLLSATSEGQASSPPSHGTKQNLNRFSGHPAQTPKLGGGFFVEVDNINNNSFEGLD